MYKDVNTPLQLLTQWPRTFRKIPTFLIFFFTGVRTVAASSCDTHTRTSKRLTIMFQYQHEDSNLTRCTHICLTVCTDQSLRCFKLTFIFLLLVWQSHLLGSTPTGLLTSLICIVSPRNKAYFFCSSFFASLFTKSEKPKPTLSTMPEGHNVSFKKLSLMHKTTCVLNTVDSLTFF